MKKMNGTMAKVKDGPADYIRIAEVRAGY